MNLIEHFMGKYVYVVREGVRESEGGEREERGGGVNEAE